MVMFQWLCVRAHAQITVPVHLASLGAKDGSPYETAAARFSMEAARLEMCLEGSGGAEFLLRSWLSSQIDFTFAFCLTVY